MADVIRMPSAWSTVLAESRTIQEEVRQTTPYHPQGVVSNAKEKEEPDEEEDGMPSLVDDDHRGSKRTNHPCQSYGG